MSMKLFEKITIVGVGLLGASLAKACRKYNLVEKFRGSAVIEKTWRKPSPLALLIVTP